MLGIPKEGNLAGKLYVTSGLGGMSGAQGKAADIAGAASIIAEVDISRIMTRYTQGWVDKYTDSLDQALEWAQAAQKAGEPCAGRLPRQRRRPAGVPDREKRPHRPAL